MERIDIECFKSAACLLQKHGFRYLTSDGHLKIGYSDPPSTVIQVDDAAQINYEQNNDVLVDPVVTQEFEKLFRLIFNGWPPERRGNHEKAKMAFFNQAEKNKYKQEFIDGFEYALYAYSRDDKERHADKPKHFFKTLSEWIIEWENWESTYHENIGIGKLERIKSGSLWKGLRAG